MSSLRIAALTVLLVGASLLASLIAPSTTEYGSSSPTPTASDSLAPSSLPSPAASGSATPEASVTPSPSNSPRPTTAPSSSPTTTPTPRPTATPTPKPTASGTSLLTLLGRLVLADESQGTSYDRARFRHWIDADGDGCDTRNEVLIAEAVSAPTIGAGCTLSGGSWRSAYDGLTTTNPSSFDVDHLVPLKEAWVSGAFAWSDARREAFANDLGVSYALIAVSATTNRSKSDQDPADWMPPATSYTCRYIGDWIAVKLRWSLTINYQEFTALYDYASGCPAYGSEVTPLP